MKRMFDLLTQNSTWTGIIALITLIGAQLNSTQAEYITGTGILVAGIIAAFLPRRIGDPAPIDEGRSFLMNRLSESSTWAGIIGCVTVFGTAIAPDMKDALIQAGLGFGGFMAVLWPDSNHIDSEGAFRYILDRMDEPNSWAGVVAALSAVGLYISPENADKITTIGMTLVGSILTFLDDRSEV